MIDALELFDRELFLAINGWHSGWADRLMWFFSYTSTTIAFVLLFSYFIYRKKGRRKTLEFLLGCLLVAATTDVTANAIKHSVKRYRPTHNHEIGLKIHIVNDYRGGKYGFLSGHACNTFGVVNFIFLCLHWITLKKRLLLFLFAFVVAYSRVYLGVHYPSDILAGAAVGTMIGSVGFYIMNRSFLKFNVQRT